MISSTEDSRPSKRAKLTFFRPFPPSGAVSTRKLWDDDSLAKMTLDFLDSAESFFPRDVEEPGPIVIGRKVQQALGRKDFLDETLRNAIYTDLMENHDIQFPTSSMRWRSEMRLRSTLNLDYRYKEADLAHLLNEFYEQINDDGGGGGAGAEAHGLVPERILAGLNVTTTSLPDMTVLRGESLFFGEFKNSAKYETETAANQCVLYLYALLYFFRVRLGRPVKAVFGFVVCGCGCFSDMMYSVGFVRLSVPDKLGGSMVPQVHVQYYGTDDDSGIQRLVHFLKRGKILERGTTNIEVVEPSHRIPALLTLPEALWESEFLVRNGTASMVFKGNADAMQGLLDQIDPDSIFYPGAFLSSVGDLFSQLSATDRQTRDFYLKIMLKDTTLQEFPSDVIGALKKRANDCYKEVYPVTPVGDDRFGLFLMNDCGTVLHESEEFTQLSFAQFLVLYRDFWAQTIDMSNFLLHGDALPHNIVYKEDAKKLVLIDFDEGIKGKKAPKRVIDDEQGNGNGMQYQYLRYPNFYRLWLNRRVYTQLQLVASFLLIVPLFERVTNEGENLKLLRDSAATADSFLRRHNAEEPRVDSHDESVRQVITLMEGILNRVAS